MVEATVRLASTAVALFGTGRPSTPLAPTEPGPPLPRPIRVSTTRSGPIACDLTVWLWLNVRAPTE